MIKDGDRYYIYRTGNGIRIKYSTDLRNWTNGGSVFPGRPPSWIAAAVPNFTGNFWAPDIAFFNGKFHLYYSCSTFGSQVSAIGLVTTTNLTTGPWTDQGAVILSTNGSAFNAIDPGVLLASNGTLWMAFGSFWGGIKMIQLDPATGKRITPSSTIYSLATHPPTTAIEAASLVQRGNYFYLFVNWDTCCAGITSTYNIRVGRSASVTGPYLDRAGASLAGGGGSMFLESTGRYIGPGHAGVMNDNGTHWLTYHYYDGNQNGRAELALGRLSWTADDWPAFTNDWSAFYTFDVDAREHLAQYNGALRSGAEIANEPGRGQALALNGTSNYVSLPFPVANASTFAAWVKWNGGDDWQRVFDFGSNTTKYLFLTPRANSGKLRFVIRNNGPEQIVEAPTALATGSWQHVAVTLDGVRSLLYLNGNSVATNNSITIRPWQLLARTNYVGESQFTSDPAFNGRIDSFRIFGRALSSSEIRELAWAHPGLAHRYSFKSNAWDSAGMAHGGLMGNATVTNDALTLTGVPGSYVNLPGGLASGSSALTVEFWASFGVNGNWARLFDFGNINGPNGQNYVFYSPHSGLGNQRMELSTSVRTVTFDPPGTLDNRALHVVCIYDPANSNWAIYTNAVLQNAQTAALPPLNGVSGAWSFIGRSLFGTDAWLNATIDEFRIYDGRLTPEEIAANFKFGSDVLALPVTLVQSNSIAGLNLSWPSYAAGFTVETRSTLDDGAWSPISQTPNLDSDRWHLDVSATNPAQFFRLRR